MKGIIGLVRCDEEGCPHAFISPIEGMKGGHTDSVQMANDAERLAVAEGWTADTRGRVRHYCPGHSAEKRHAEREREKAFGEKPGNPDRPVDPKPDKPEKPDKPGKR